MDVAIGGVQVTDREALKKYLGRYYIAKKRHRQLQERLAELERDIYGLSAIRYDDMPKAPSSKPNTKSEKQIEKCEELRENIRKSAKKINLIMSDILEVVECLPEDTDERLIVEYRDIDCLSWDAISDRANITRMTASRKYNKGIDLLLTVDKVAEIVAKYKIQ